MPRVLVVSRECVGQIQPLQTVIRMIQRLGIKCSLFCRDIEIEWEQDILRNGGEVYKTGMCRSKVLGDLAFRRHFIKLVRSLMHDEVVVWIVGIDCLRALRGLPYHNVLRYVVHVLELYDCFPFYRMLMRRFLPHAAIVVVPEESRAFIIRSWCNLQETPVILPNKPIAHPRKLCLELTDVKARSAFEKIPEDAHIVLYQGGIYKERDIRTVAKAVYSMGHPWRFLALGKSSADFIDRVKEICPDLVHISFIPPPCHLEVTSHAHIGIATYDFSSLNNVFCAPNKIWEYAGFGIPILFNDNPGLRHTVQLHGAGKSADFSDPQEIQDCLLEIEGDYNSYSERASEMFDSVDLDQISNKIINKALRCKS